MQHLKGILQHRRRLGLVGKFSLFLGVLVTMALLIFWVFLADYQNSLPQNLADKVMSAYQTGDIQMLEEYIVNLPEPLKNPALFTKYYEDNTDLANLYFYQGAVGKATELCYEFVSGSDTIATLTLQKSGHTSLLGFPEYEISAITGHPLTNYKITAPSDAMLFVNGKLLSERYRTDEHTAVNNFSALSGTVFQTKTYEITDFCYIDELTVFSSDDCDTAVTWSEDNLTATVQKSVSTEQQAEISAFAEHFSKVYSIFATKRNGVRAPVVSLLQPGTPFYRAITLYNNEWGKIYSVDRHDNMVIDSFVRYSPTEFSCDIKFDYVIKAYDGIEKTYPYRMTYYLTKQGGRLMLIDMQSKS